MSKLFKQLSLIIFVSIFVVGTLVYFAIGETRPNVGNNPIDSVSATVISVDTLKVPDTTKVIKDSVTVKDTTEVKWESKWGNQKGEASMYGHKDGYHGKKTASGIIFDTYGSNQCAHRYLPFGTLLKVENLKTGDTTTVKVTDRGPFAHGRIIDLSYKSMNDIKMKNIAQVKLTVVYLPPKYSKKTETIDKPKKEKKEKVKKTKKTKKTTKKTK